MNIITEHLVRELKYKASIYNAVGSAWELNRAEAMILQALLLRAADTIEFLLKRVSTNNRWIPCSERLPEEKINPVTKDFYEYQVTFQSENVTDIRHYKFGNGHWWNGPGIMDGYVTAWRESLEAYHE